jgi:S-adenosylmethionine:tRNA ribosyltransferase-isomerase
MHMTLDDFDFELPPDLIAQHPAPERTASRLLVVDAAPGGLHASGQASVHHETFADIEAHFTSGDVLVFNDTRVIKARLLGEKASGGKVELLVERVLPGQRVVGMLRASKTPKPGGVIHFSHPLDRAQGQFSAALVGRQDDFFELQFPEEPFGLLERFGSVPLPPYIGHAADSTDEQRYQTVYADKPGSVAAPTAGLHFDQALLARLESRGVVLARVTLHVGAGTFLPVRTQNIAEHKMHSEWYDIPAATVAAVQRAQAQGGRVTAVGTTSMRSLEAAAQFGGGALVAGARETDIFITPGFSFKVVDRLITNFHLPKSTLMMLVSAFAGHAQVMSAYQQAIAQRYRFFSYGDAMLLNRALPEAAAAKA